MRSVVANEEAWSVVSLVTEPEFQISGVLGAEGPNGFVVAVHEVVGILKSELVEVDVAKFFGVLTIVVGHVVRSLNVAHGDTSQVFAVVVQTLVVRSGETDGDGAAFVDAESRQRRRAVPELIIVVTMVQVVQNHVREVIHIDEADNVRGG